MTKLELQACLARINEELTGLSAYVESLSTMHRYSLYIPTPEGGQQYPEVTAPICNLFGGVSGENDWTAIVESAYRPAAVIVRRDLLNTSSGEWEPSDITVEWQDV